jgi:flagellar biosynthesis/type III secretory pathway protein FliH
MPDGFITLVQWLRADAPPVLACEPEVAIEIPDDAPCEPAAYETLVADVCARVRRFRASLTEALDRSLADLLRDIAAEVIGRELQLAPSDLAAIVRRALERCVPDEVLAVHVHPAQIDACRLDVPVVPDSQLRRDDATIALRSGSIDVRLGVRLERLLER